MKIIQVNEMSLDIFINNFKNVFENTPSISISTEKMRPFKNKKSLDKKFFKGI